MSVVARIKKILHIDEEIMACSNNGAFAITIATARSERLFPGVAVANDRRKCSYAILRSKH